MVLIYFLPNCGFVGDLVDAVVPFMGESITDGTLAKFLKSMLFYLSSNYLHFNQYSMYMAIDMLWADPGDRVQADEPIAQIETDKVILER